MNKKIAITTWCNTDGPTNYGQNLQGYALEKTLENKGYEVTIVRYRKFRENEKKIWTALVTYLPKFIREQYEKVYFKKYIDTGNSERIAKFMSFMKKNMNVSYICYTKKMVEEETKDAGFLICGSDQIWNPMCVEDVYLLDFGKPNQIRFSYAASGIFFEDSYTENAIIRMKSSLENMKAISVRENIGEIILEKYLGLYVQTVLDPVFLLDKKAWNSISAPVMSKGTYIFVYTLGSIQSNQLLIKKLRALYQVDYVYYIPTPLMNNVDLKDCHKIENAGPEEFVSWIKNGACVLTDSFHAVAMSIIYEKEFFIVKRNQPNMKMIGGPQRNQNILNEFGIVDRFVYSTKDLDKIIEIDYSKVAKVKQQKIKAANNYLEEALYK